MTDPELQQLLSQLRDEPAPFPSVSAGVLAHVERYQRRRSRSLWTGLAATAALVFMTLAIRPAWRVEPMPAPRFAAVKPPAFIHNPPSVAATRPVGRPRRVTPRPRQLPFETETLTVKVVTDDPDVVIYWIVEGQGESQ